jgi:hypothetical protein
MVLDHTRDFVERRQIVLVVPPRGLQDACTQAGLMN